MFRVCPAFLSVRCSFVVTCWERAGHVGDVYCIFVTFPCGTLGQMWYLIVSFPQKNQKRYSTSALNIQHFCFACVCYIDVITCRVNWFTNETVTLVHLLSLRPNELNWQSDE